MPRMAEMAIQKALTEQVVTRIEIPANLIGENIVSDHYTRPLLQSSTPQAPTREQLDKAAAAINNGKHVALFCGIGWTASPPGSATT